MNNRNPLFDLYIKQCSNLYSKKVYPDQYVNMLENINLNKTGFIKLNIINQRDNSKIPNATITIYVTQGAQRDIPIMHLITTLNPVRIELPIAYDLGTQITGPEYDFSTYNLRVDAFEYFAENIYNIRLFPDTTTDFEIGMIPIRPAQSVPEIEERIDIPPHPRDVIIDETNRI